MVGIFVVIMVVILGLGGAAITGGKFDNWTKRFVRRSKYVLKRKKKQVTTGFYKVRNFRYQNTRNEPSLFDRYQNENI